MATPLPDAERKCCHLVVSSPPAVQPGRIFTRKSAVSGWPHSGCFCDPGLPLGRIAAAKFSHIGSIIGLESIDRADI